MFHYTTEAIIYGIAHHERHLFMEDDNNQLLNPFACYILDRLHT